MMPFGVGRRICLGLGLAFLRLAFLHLDYNIYVANLIWKFEWKAMDGNEISLEEKQEFTVVLKTPLKAHRIRKWEEVCPDKQARPCFVCILKSL
ncbi:hypothetical protein REPUB_Repub13aG0169400 [Reevesia pubescens]